MSQCLKIHQIKKNNNRIEYFYSTEGKWNQLLNCTEKMYVEYDENIESVPDSLAIVPFLCNILPISWVFDLSISIDVIDKNFYECLINVKEGYSNMYPSLPMLGELEVKTIQENKYLSSETGTLFSGGVDAFDTLFQHIEEKPLLLTLWGADVDINDNKGFNNVREQVLKTAKKFSLKTSFIKSNFRKIVNEANLSEYVFPRVNDGWWHGFQHGIGILGHVAPIAFLNKMKVVYIASSFTAEYKGLYTCASDPTIDNYLRYGSCSVIHDGYEFNRQDKIHNICQYAISNNIEKIPVRVCWESVGGDNCCECEKCYRTILGIIAEKEDPNNFGFNFTIDKRSKMMKMLPKYVKYNARYLCIQKRMLQNYNEVEFPKDLYWFRDMVIKTKKPFLLQFKSTFMVKIKSKIKSILKK